MGDRKDRIIVMQTVLMLLFGFFVSQLDATDGVKFYESFDETFKGRWIPSVKEDYKGVWKWAKSEGYGDYGLLVSEKARKYAIVKEFDEPVDLKDGAIVLQYEVRFQKGLECGGAYIKYLRPQKAGWIAKEFDNESPYGIMFGPDKCGATNKVHFILKHMNPNRREYVEHHLKFPPPVPSDNLTHVYTATLRPDNELRILVDGEEKKKANFFSNDDFDPPLVPPKTIPDPDDKKPDDWDERAKIPDLDAKKPDDWDEDAPMEIVDEDAVKPEGWLDDEPDEIDDPEARKPKDWNEEEDGEWEAPKIDNPKCEEAPGCGEWKRPLKSNPEYKGKWSAPLIKNPNYMGTWKPQLIGNPDHFELDRPNFDPIAAIGIEIWTMQDGLLFDNILIASNETVAESYRETAWKPKFDVEKEKHKQKSKEAANAKALKGVQKMVFKYLYKVADFPVLGAHKAKVLDLLKKAEKQPNLTIGVLVSSFIVFLTILLKLAPGGKKPPKVPAKTKKLIAAQASNNPGSSEEKEGKATNARQRSTRRYG